MCHWWITLWIKVIKNIIFNRKDGYFLYNCIMYKIFLSATYQMVLHCMIYGKIYFGVESSLLRLCVTIKWHFSSVSFQFSVGANCTVLCYPPNMYVDLVQFVIQMVFYICWSWSSYLSDHFVSNIFYQSFNHVLMQLQVRQSWKFLLIHLLVSAPVSSNKFALKQHKQFIWKEAFVCFKVVYKQFIIIIVATITMTTNTTVITDISTYLTTIRITKTATQIRPTNFSIWVNTVKYTNMWILTKFTEDSG